MKIEIGSVFNFGDSHKAILIPPLGSLKLEEDADGFLFVILCKEQLIELSRHLDDILEEESEMAGKAKKKFIQDAIKRPGALRKKLKVKKGEKIPVKKLAKAEHSKDPTTRKQAVLAKTLKKLSKHKKRK